MATLCTSEENVPLIVAVELQRRLIQLDVVRCTPGSQCPVAVLQPRRMKTSFTVV
jgi:hypothetical protein